MTPSRDSSSYGTGSGSPGTGSQAIGTSSGRQVLDEEVQEVGLPREATSKKRKPSWLKEIVKEAKEYVGPPRRDVRESR